MVASRSSWVCRRRAGRGSGSCRKRRNPNATRLTRLIRLLIASVGPLVTWAWCQATIWLRQRTIVRPSRRTSGGHLGVCEVTAELVDERVGELGVGVVVDLSGRLPWRARRCAPRLVGSPASSRPSSSVVAVDRRGVRRPSSTAGGSGRAGRLAASVAEGLVLHPAAALVELRVGQTCTRWNGSATWTASGSIVSNTARYDADRSSVAQPIAARHSSGRAANQAHGSTLSRPGTTSSSRPARDVDDRGRPHWRAPRALTGEQRLVQPDRGRRRRSGRGRRSTGPCRRRSRRR